MSKLRLNFKSVTTLVVDRDRYTRSLICQMLRGFGVGRIESVDTGAAAQDYIRENFVDLCIIEASLPDMSGAELIHWVRREMKEPARFMPILVLTGYTQQKLISESRDAGSNLVVKKPVSAQVLFDRVGWIAKTPRAYIETSDFVGPDRRFREIVPPDGVFRRETDAPVQPDAADSKANGNTA
jgi:CheY-like chemotaxis protein